MGSDHLTRYVVLLRGINVGGHNKLRMQDLKNALTGNGFEDVLTYIQSGNVVLRHTRVPAKVVADNVSRTCEEVFNLSIDAWAASADEFETILADNPYPDAINEPKNLHALCAQAPLKVDNATMEALTALLADTESFEVIGRCLYLHTPQGIGQSKFAAAAERKVGIPVTARNWRTMRVLHDMVRS